MKVVITESFREDSYLLQVMSPAPQWQRKQLLHFIELSKLSHIENPVPDDTYERWIVGNSEWNCRIFDLT